MTSPLSLTRISSLLDDSHIANFRDGEVLRVGFSNCWIAFQLETDTLLLEAVWNAHPTAEQAAQVLVASNEWNLTHPTPTLSFVESEPGQLTLSATRRIRSGEGLSDNQLGAFLTTTIEAVGACFEWLEPQFPELIDWEDDL